MEISKYPQRSPEWYAERCGVPTSSNFDKIVTTKGEPSKQRQKYMYRLAGEAITGIQEETYQNQAMLRGVELESEARELYTLITGLEVAEVGFCKEKGYGASPDGLVATEGILEIKCPLVATHVGYLLDNKLPIDYFQQVHGQLYVTGRKWVDFLSYSPGLKPLLIRVERNDAFVVSLARELEIFCKELNEVIERIK